MEPLTFQSRFVEGLRADPKTGGRSRPVRGSHYSLVDPTRVAQPKLIAWSAELAQELGLEEGWSGNADPAHVLAGQAPLPGMRPFAMCYGGHQFGHWAGQLGDGRAINLGESLDREGRLQTWQLKGAGPTPYSRSADGWAVLRSSLREFLCSEAMHHLGVPTTRALSLVLSGDEVMRDMFYDGNARLEPGAIVCRVAPSFVRFGNFEIFAAREEHDLLRELADFVIDGHFPHLTEGGPKTPETYLAWFREVAARTAEMIVHWSRVGFVHGVMNTDNLSILGLTIDYGPYGWLEDFDPSWTPNTTDASGRRYAFGAQAQIGLWNLLKLANAIVPLAQDVDGLQEALGSYTEAHDRGWERMLASKLGLSAWNEETDRPLIDDLLNLLKLTETDWTLFFRDLASFDPQAPLDAGDIEQRMRTCLYTPDDLGSDYWGRLGTWMARYQARCQQSELGPEERQHHMNRNNPRFVLRNYLAQLAIEDAERGDYAKLLRLQEVLKRPYDEQPEHVELAAKRPDWARTKPGCSMLSCSS